MSLNSYRKIIGTEQRREGLCTNEASDMPLSEQTENVEYSSSKPKKFSMGKLIFGSIIIATLFLAALKNPSRTEAKDEIQTMIVDLVMDKMRNEITDESDNVWEQIGSGIAMFFASTIIDNMIETKVSDYIFFSTFDTSVTVDDEKRTLVGGVIVFGKVIPLKSYIKEEFLSVFE